MEHKQMGEKNSLAVRDSNMELLRILCMFGIVLNHFAIYPPWDFGGIVISFNKLLIQILLIFGKLGVNCFILISGYFMIRKTSRRVSSILKIWLQILFYSLLIPVVFSVFHLHRSGTLEWIWAFLPLISEKWIFATYYFVLMIFSPYLNSFLNSLDRKQYKTLLLFMMILWCVIPTFTNRYMGSGDASGEGFVWFIVMYSVGGYIRRFGNNIKSWKNIYIFIVVAFLFYICTVVALDLLSVKIPAVRGHEVYFRGAQKIPQVVLSVSVFVLFTKLNLGKNKAVNLIASATFGVYLIHSHPYVRAYILEHHFDPLLVSSPALALYALLIPVGVYAVCTVIDLLRIKFVEKSCFPVINTYFTEALSKLENKIE